MSSASIYWPELDNDDRANPSKKKGDDKLDTPIKNLKTEIKKNDVLISSLTTT